MQDNSQTITLADEAATQALGIMLAALARPGDVITLAGPLGAGKSTLARAFIRAVTDDGEDVPSPTFTLVQTYDGDHGPIWHMDLYRLEQSADALELGIEDAFIDAICLIEWPDRLGRMLPRRRIDIVLDAVPDTPGQRVAHLTRHGDWRHWPKDVTPHD